MQQHKKQGFTLVELIVVVTILAILATIGFVSYSSYLTGVRDTNRIAQLTSISDGLNLYSTKNDLPIPDDNVEVSVSGALIAYQGTAGANTLETIDFSKGGKDPKDDTHYSYYLTKDRKYFQLMAFLEESENLTSGIIDTTHAIDYTDRIPTVSGRKLGILTNNEKVPIEQLGSDLDLALSDTTDYIAHISSELTIVGDTVGNSDLENMENIVAAGGTISRSCKELLYKKPGLKNNDGAYMINPGGQGARLVYCDMTTDGGGWTLIISDGIAENTSELNTMTSFPTPVNPGLHEYYLSVAFKDLATSMRIVSIDTVDLYADYDLRVSGAFPTNLGSANYGYMYANQDGFTGGIPGMSKCNLRTALTDGCNAPSTFPYDSESSGGVIGTASTTFGCGNYSWQFEKGSTLFKLGWTVPSNRVYYDAREASYLMIR